MSTAALPTEIHVALVEIDAVQCAGRRASTRRKLSGRYGRKKNGADGPQWPNVSVDRPAGYL